jgi:hypothetical protein
MSKARTMVLIFWFHSHVLVLKDFEFFFWQPLLKMKTQFMLWITKIKFAQIHAEMPFSFHMYFIKHC